MIPVTSGMLRCRLLFAAVIGLSIAQAMHPAEAAPFGNGRGISIAALASVDYPTIAGPFVYHTADSSTVLQVVDRSSPAFLRSLRADGFGFVRLVTSPLPLTQRGPERAVAFATLLRTVQSFRAAGLRVVVDLHFWSPSPYTQDELLVDPSKRVDFIKAAITLAKLLSRRPGVALELLNEPKACAVKPGIDWRAFQRKLVQKIRLSAPRLSLILTGCVGQVDGLLALDASSYVGDPNLYYTFHFYEPFVFTHQNTYYELRGVPFPPPSGPTGLIGTLALDKYLTASSRVNSEVDLRNYMNDPHPIANMARRMNLVKTWASRYRVPPAHILLGEFGTTLDFRDNSTPLRTDYLRWAAEVRRLATAQGFAWAYWSTTGDFDPSNNRLRSDIRRALGLASHIRTALRTIARPSADTPLAEAAKPHSRSENTTWILSLRRRIAEP